MLPKALTPWIRRLDSWATRSIVVGAAVTGFDVAVGMTALHFGVSTRWAAMLGTAVGLVLSYFANRVFAFKAENPLARSAGTYFVLMVLSVVLHGQIVLVLRESWAVPFVVAKMGADLLVFTVGHLLVLRYLVFPEKRAAATPPASPPSFKPLPSAPRANPS